MVGHLKGFLIRGEGWWGRGLTQISKTAMAKGGGGGGGYQGDAENLI